MSDAVSRANRLDQALSDLLSQAPEVEAAAVVSFDGLPMASALPPMMDEDRVAAMSAALLSLGERAAEGLGRGELSQVYIEGEHGTVFLVSADNEAVLVAVATKGAKVGMMLFEVRRAAAVVAEVLRVEGPGYDEPGYDEPGYEEPVAEQYTESYDAVQAQPVQPQTYQEPAAAPVSYAPVASAGVPVEPAGGWPTYQPNGAGAAVPPETPTAWS